MLFCFYCILGNIIFNLNLPLNSNLYFLCIKNPILRRVPIFCRVHKCLAIFSLHKFDCLYSNWHPEPKNVLEKWVSTLQTAKTLRNPIPRSVSMKVTQVTISSLSKSCKKSQKYQHRGCIEKLISLNSLIAYNCKMYGITTRHHIFGMQGFF